MSCVLAYNSQNGKSAFVLRKIIKFCSPHVVNKILRISLKIIRSAQSCSPRFAHSIKAKIHRFSVAFDDFPSESSGKTTPGFN